MQCIGKVRRSHFPVKRIVGNIRLLRSMFDLSNYFYDPSIPDTLNCYKF